MKDGQSAWASQTLELITAAQNSGVDSDTLRRLVSSIANIDVAIKVSQQTTRLLEEYKAGTLSVTDFLDAILIILQTDKPLMGTKIEVLHKALGVPIIQKAPRPKKVKPAAA